MQRPNWKSDLPRVNCVYQRYMYVDFFIGDIGPPNHVQCIV